MGRIWVRQSISGGSCGNEDPSDKEEEQYGKSTSSLEQGRNEMGTRKGGKVDEALYYFGEALSYSAEVLYELDPRRFDKSDFVFAFSFFVFIASAFAVFWIDSIRLTLASLLVMLLAVCFMGMSMSYEYVFGEEDEIQQMEDKKEDTVDKNDPFGGDAFE